MRTILALLATAVFAFTPMPAATKNAELSTWMRNLSESALATEPGTADWAPEVAVSGVSVHAIWSTQGATDWTLHYRRSTNGGATWEDKKALHTDTDNLNQPTFRRIAVDGSTVHVVQSHYRGTGGGWYGVLTYFRSIDGGATFEAARDIVTGGSVRHIGNTYVAAAGGKVTVGYTDKLNYATDHYVMAATSEDNGATFTLRQVLHTTTSDPGLADLQVAGDSIYAVIPVSHGYAGGGYDAAFDLHFAASANRGVSFTTNLISVPSNVLDSGGNGVHKTKTLQDYHYAPKVASAGSNVLVTWTGIDATGKDSLFYRRSTDGGLTFGNAVNATTPVLPANRAPRWGSETLEARGSSVYLGFVIVDNGYTTNPTVNIVSSADSGATFTAIKELSPLGVRDVGGGWWPLVRTDPSDATGAKVHVLWNQPTHVSSTDGGKTFTAPALLSTFFTNPGGNRPQMAVDGDGVLHYVFEKQQYSSGAFGDQDIFYRRLAPVGPVGPDVSASLRFTADKALNRWDNMQVRASPDTNFTTAMTVEAWVLPDRDPAINPYYVFKADPGKGGAWGSYILGQWIDGKAQAGIATTASGYVMNGTTTLANGAWAHLAMTYDAAGGADNFRLYVNGSLEATATVTGSLVTDDGPLFIGMRGNDYPIYPSVAIDEVRLWNRALAQAEILANRVTPLSGGESGLVAYHPLDGTTRDATGRGNDGILMYTESYVGGVTFPPVTSLPVITSATSAVFKVGVAGTFTVTATGAPKPTLSMTGALPAGVTFTPATGVLGGTPAAGTAGTYTLNFKAANGVLPDAMQGFSLSVDESPASIPRLGNISTRGPVLTGNDVMIGGFIIGGSTPKKVLITARGPSLVDFGITNPLANPKIDLYAGQMQIIGNDNWQTNANAADILALGTFPTGLAPSNPLEAALLVTLPPGAYTAVVSGADGGTGVGIVEVFEQDKPEVPLVNISTRGQVQAANNVMIGGFIIQGAGPQKVLITARGPSLAAFGIANPLANPKLEIFSGQVKIFENDNWESSANAAEILALGTFPSGLAPSNALEAAILVTLQPGAYTAVVSGVGDTTGVGIVEVFAR